MVTTGGLLLASRPVAARSVIQTLTAALRSDYLLTVEGS
jgi:hypothetical protein